MEKISKDEYYIDGERVNQHNMTKYIKTLSFYGYMPDLDYYKETDEYMKWTICYSGGWGGGFYNSLYFMKNTNMWIADNEGDTYCSNVDPSHPSYSLLENKDGNYTWTSPHIEDIFPVAFLFLFDCENHFNNKISINPRNCSSIINDDIRKNMYEDDYPEDAYP